MASTLHSRTRPVFRLIAAVLMCAGTLSPAFAVSVQDAEQLLRQKQPQQALEKIDQFLAERPRDPQGRFFKGLILTELGRVPEATSVFQKLTEDYPELPEPYNNLAVLYAQQKQYDKAKTALEMAIRTHPSYAVAHENLGDIYARMATQAYDRALQLDSSNTGAQSKLNMIREMVGSPPKAGAKTSASAAPPRPAPAPASPPVAPAATKPAAPTAAVAPPPTPAAAPAAIAAAPATAAVETPPAAPALPTAELTAAVDAWAAAWSRKDVKGYLAHYADDFAVPGKRSRSAWEAERRSRIDKPGTIEVGIEDIRFKAEAPDRIRATFRQSYRSVGLKSTTTKTLTLVRRNGQWLIQQERIGG